MKGTNRLAVLGLVTTLALILSYVESLIPVFVGIPGVKLGLGNLATVFLLYRYTLKDTILVVIVRVFISGFMFGNLMSITFSLAGGLLSVVVMAALKRTQAFSVMGVSIVGGCMHNIGQLIIAAFVVSASALVYYVPALLISGVITGLLIGIGADILIKRLPRFRD